MTHAGRRDSLMTLAASKAGCESVQKLRVAGHQSDTRERRQKQHANE